MLRRLYWWLRGRRYWELRGITGWHASRPTPAELFNEVRAKMNADTAAFVPYCRMADDKGREYVMVACDCRDCRRGRVPKGHVTTEYVARLR